MLEDQSVRGKGDEAARVGLIVPLQRAAPVSSRRTWSAVIAWLLCLSGIITLGVVAQLSPAAGSTLAVDPGTPPPAYAAAAPTPQTSRAAAALPGPAATSHRSLGEDGLVGGLPFGDTVPRLTQADIERDGYRYYGQLLAHDPGTGR